MLFFKVEPKDNYILRIYLDTDEVLDFNVKAEIERIPCYKPLYAVSLFTTVKFKNNYIYWNDQIDFHIDQIRKRGLYLTIVER